MSDPTNISGVNIGDLKLTLVQAKDLLQDTVNDLQAENHKLKAEIVRLTTNQERGKL